MIRRPTRGRPVKGVGRLHSAETKHIPIGRLTPAESIVAEHWPSFRGRGLPRGVADSPVAQAVVNHGRWIVKCPFCTSAQNASKEDHRFFCIECSNLDIGMQWVRVEWPPNVRDIEQVLLRRSNRRLRNWTPADSIEQLLAENAFRGF